MDDTILVAIALVMIPLIAAVLIAQPQFRHQTEQRIDDLQAEIRDCTRRHDECEKLQVRQAIIIERLISGIVTLGGNPSDYHVSGF